LRKALLADDSDWSSMRLTSILLELPVAVVYHHQYHHSSSSSLSSISVLVSVSLIDCIYHRVNQIIFSLQVLLSSCARMRDTRGARVRASTYPAGKPGVSSAIARCNESGTHGCRCPTQLHTAKPHPVPHAERRRR